MTPSENLVGLAAENEMLRAVLLGIASRSTHEGGCYYNNRLSIFEAREALKKCGVDWIAKNATLRSRSAQ